MKAQNYENYQKGPEKLRRYAPTKEEEKRRKRRATATAAPAASEVATATVAFIDQKLPSVAKGYH